ncbi:hypothetical protein ABOM_001909, partial [Aspergillus bombycis]
HARVIEQKLDDIMTILHQDRERVSRTDRLPPHSQFPNEGSTSYQDHPPLDATTPPPSGSISIVPGFEVSFVEANQALQEYMTVMLPEFPFVPLPSLKACDMYKDKPFLLKTILWACRPPGPDVSATFEKWFRQYIAHQTISLVNKNLELVQALLLFFAWNDIYFSATNKDTGLLYLAIGLVEDLGLARPRRTVNPTFKSIFEDAAQMRNALPPQPTQTNADHRTFLGVYYITSTLCSLLGKRSRLEYTAHFDHCCAQLLHDQEYPTDALLVNLIHIRKIAMKVNDTFWETIDITNSRPLGNVHFIAVASIRNELDCFMRELPDHLKSNHLIQTHSAAVCIRLFEPFKYGDRGEMLEPSHLRYRLMWDCLESTRELYNAFLLVPVKSYPYLTFASILHLALAIIKAMRLLCVEDHAWELDTARTMYNLPNILQQLSNLFEAASNSGSPRCKIVLHGQPIFSNYAESYRGIERHYLSMVNSGATHSDSAMTEPAITNYGEQYDFELWNQLCDLTYGFVP